LFIWEAAAVSSPAGQLHTEQSRGYSKLGINHQRADPNFQTTSNYGFSARRGSNQVIPQQHSFVLIILSFYLYDIYVGIGNPFNNKVLSLFEVEIV